ncbi:MAG: AbrB/MazE/SpoVT family DNA-binding domain-containing protein [Candidatus Lokiarchaeota archaeon]|nr:AbrB/MazE/SpoVT family DNA-binding domain-containing protein [Candidatus Lokiarchaeota archaeon]
MEKTTLTRNFQVTIPKKIRNQLGLKLGDEMRIRVEDGKIVMEPTDDAAWDEFPSFLPDNFEKVQEHLRHHATERFRRLGIL